MSAELAIGTLSREEARSLTDEVRNDAERLWAKLVELYDGGAHKALGYSSWAAYFKAEFGGSRPHAYQLLDAGRVMAALTQSPNGDSVILNKSQARELAPLKGDPEVLRDAWAEVVELHPDPTAEQIREVVSAKLPMNKRATLNANAAKRKLYDVLSSVNGYSSALPDFALERALVSATEEDVAAWERLAGDSVRALNNLRRALKEPR